VDFGPVGSMPIGRVNPGGDRGFTLTFSDNLSVQTAAATCSFPECPPGATIKLHAFASTDFGGGRGLTACPTVPCQGIDPFPCGNAFIQFTGQTVAPPLGDFTKAILKVPVEFGGFFSHTDGFGAFGSEQLVASAIATLTLTKGDFSGFPQFLGEKWRYDGIRYELEPVPEPATLLLWEMTAAGLGLTVRRKRRRTRDSQPSPHSVTTGSRSMVPAASPIARP